MQLLRKTRNRNSRAHIFILECQNMTTQIFGRKITKAIDFLFPCETKAIIR